MYAMLCAKVQQIFSSNCHRIKIYVHYLKSAIEMKESHGTEHRREVNRPVSSTTSEFLRPLFDFMNFEVKLTVDEVVDWLSLRLPEWSVTRNFIISTSISNTPRSVENLTSKFLRKPASTKVWCAVFIEWFSYNERDDWRLCYHKLTT